MTLVVWRLAQLLLRRCRRSCCRRSSHLFLLCAETKHGLGLDGYLNVFTVRNIKERNMEQTAAITEACNNLTVQEEECSCEFPLVHPAHQFLTELKRFSNVLEQMPRGSWWPLTCWSKRKAAGDMSTMRKYTWSRMASQTSLRRTTS